ncbi:MAG: dihydrofolate reductase [Solirubrobacterales bacterium]|nr:dihydrofolate reductase [Solirubrobacterales bacterium]MCO5327032.1 dihydrofolate reductase family protein [Solirubrobacterales bacterium]
MARLTYTALCSLDGYIEDGGGGFGWAMPDRELHAFVNERERGTGTMLLGRRMYETLAVWETMPTEGEPAELADYKEIWLGADKVVYSRKLREPASGRTRIEAEFDPAAVRRMKEGADRDLSIGGPEIAAAAFASGLVDEIGLFFFPVVVGGGKRALPEGARLALELREERRFGSGVVYLGYTVANSVDGAR